jgi:site-specific DNA-methyltransferase (adenine-specific)
MTHNSVILGDCLKVLGEMPDESVDLVYLDPPFFTQKIHTLSNRQGTKHFSFSDIWNSNADYARFLYERLTEVRRVLKLSGSVFFHCDRNSVHIARFVLDDVFGPAEFRSEVIWHFRRWSNAQKGLLPAHQTILFYSKSPEFKFCNIITEYSPSTNADQILQKRVRDDRGKTVYARDGGGIIVSNGAKKGVPLSDVWEIPYLNPKAKERIGYPTQKPILLLERIINLTTDVGDVVVDPFCGSGTTLVAAKLLQRHWIGIDCSDDAVTISRERLVTPVRTSSTLMEKGRAAYVNNDKVVEALMFGLDHVRVHRNAGIDCILKDDVDGKPVLIRIQRPDETIHNAAHALKKAARNKGASILLVVATTTEDADLVGGENVKDVHIVTATARSIEMTLGQLRRSLTAVRLVS